MVAVDLAFPPPFPFPFFLLLTGAACAGRVASVRGACLCVSMLGGKAELTYMGSSQPAFSRHSGAKSHPVWGILGVGMVTHVSA